MYVEFYNMKICDDWLWKGSYTLTCKHWVHKISLFHKEFSDTEISLLLLYFNEQWALES